MTGTGVDLATRVFGNIHRVNQLAGRLPNLSNRVMNNPLGKLGAGLLGLPTERPLPRYAERRFSAERYPVHDAPDAILVIDTFSEWNHPELGRAAMALAERLGLRLNVDALAGGRLLRAARYQPGSCSTAPRRWRMRMCSPWTGRMRICPYIFLEPSCLSAFKDDYLTLVAPGIQPPPSRWLNAA